MNFNVQIDFKFKCTYCPRVFLDSKKLNVHTPDCKRKHCDNPPVRHCSNCKADYTRKSGSAYRAHMKKCLSDTSEEVKSDSAVKQSERRKKVMVVAKCKHCAEEFKNITVGKFGDHQYKCKQNKPNYDKDYQTAYRNQMKELVTQIKEECPDLEIDQVKKMSQTLRKMKLNDPSIQMKQAIQTLMNQESKCT